MQTTTEQPLNSPRLETLALNLEIDQLNAFFPLLQKGVLVPAIVGCSLKNILINQFAIPPDYVTERITTIFLDNRPVDDLDSTIVLNNSRLTLSAAMPGLVGATMRRGGFYAAMRQGISYMGGSCQSANMPGTVRLKLFNLLLAELGPLILGRGFLLEQHELNELLHKLPSLPFDPQNCADRVLLTITFS